MFLSSAALKKAERIYNKGTYSVIVNPRRQDYMKADLKEDDILHNYLIVNNDTGAIEFGVDQLPSSYEIIGKLNDEVLRYQAEKKSAVTLKKETIN